MAQCDSDAELEAKICAKLNYSAPPPEKDDGPIVKTTVRKKRKKRSRPSVLSAEDDYRSLQKSIVESEAFAQERAKQLALVQPQRDIEQSAAASGHANADGSMEIQARELNDKPQQMTEQDDAQRTNRKEQAGIDMQQYVERHRGIIGKLGAAGLNKRERRAYETAQLVKLGCRKPKNQKMPISMLANQRRNEKKRAKQKKELDLVTGMLVRVKRKRRR